MEKEIKIELLNKLIVSLKSKKIIYLSGICIHVKYLFSCGEITYDEKQFLLTFILQNKPKIFKKFYNYLQNFLGSYYFWPPKNKEVRIKWLNYQINKLNK